MRLRRRPKVHHYLLLYVYWTKDENNTTVLHFKRMEHLTEHKIESVQVFNDTLQWLGQHTGEQVSITGITYLRTSKGTAESVYADVFGEHIQGLDGLPEELQ